jgi:hypothetical protein
LGGKPFAEPGAQRFEGPRHHPGILRFVAPDEQVHDLIDQAYGIDLGGRDEPPADGVDALGKAPRRAKVGEDNATESGIGGEERFFKLVAIAGKPGDVKFEDEGHGSMIYQNVR